MRFFVSEAQKRSSPVLQIGCGPGRVLIPLARAGYPVMGVDNSPEMLTRVRKNVAREAEDVRKRITIRKDDMRRFRLDQRFNLIVIPGRGFLHMMIACGFGVCPLCLRSLATMPRQERARKERAMTVHDVTTAKIRPLPESLAQEVSDFVDFLLMRRDSTR